MIPEDRSERPLFTYDRPLAPVRTIHTSHAISVCKLFNNITVNLSRLATVMIASADNLLLIIPRTVARIYPPYVHQAPTTKLTTNGNIARAHNQWKNYPAVALVLKPRLYLNFPSFLTAHRNNNST